MVTRKKVKVEYEYMFDDEERAIFEKAYDKLYNFFMDYPCAEDLKLTEPRFAPAEDEEERIIKDQEFASAVNVLRAVLDYNKITVASSRLD